MTKEFDQTFKLIIKKQEDLAKDNNDISKNIAKINRQIKSIENKIDLILDILNNFTLMIMEDGEEEENSYNEGWTPEQSEDWNSYDENDESDLNG
jgi:seryl-tRNA synthetase